MTWNYEIFQMLSFLDSCKRVYKQQKGKFKQNCKANLFEINVLGWKFSVGTANEKIWETFLE